MASENIDKTTGDLEPWDGPTGLAAIEPTPTLVEQAYAAIMDNQVPPEIGDPQITARLIQERIKLGTFEQSLNPADSLPAWTKTLEGVEVVVYGFHLNPSTFENEDGVKGVYAVVELGDVESGEMTTVSTGAGNVLMQLVKAWEEGKFPFRATLVEKKTSTPGRSTYWLQRAQG